MLSVCLSLIPLALCLSLVGTWLMIRIGARTNAHDAQGSAGHIKDTHRRIPNIGGIAIFIAIGLPLLAGLALAGPLGAGSGGSGLAASLPASIQQHLPGIADRTPLGLILFGALLLLHLLGVYDDRQPLGPVVKLVFMLIPSVLVPWLTDTRLLTMLDPHVGGVWLSIAISAVWMLAVMNAINFIDNMDGAAAGVTVVAGALFFAASMVSGQWFVGAMLALTIGAALGFLCFNYPRAKIFMGDGGSLVLGFILGFLTVRTTYTGESPTGEPLAGGWYAVLMPLVVLAIPMYDMASVTLLRLRQGRSPMVGDLQHVTHRLVKRGLSKPAAVAVLWGFTAITGISGVFLATLAPWQALLVGIQLVALLAVLAGFEFASSPPGARHDSLRVAPANDKPDEKPAPQRHSD